MQHRSDTPLETASLLSGYHLLRAARMTHSFARITLDDIVAVLRTN